MVNNNIIYLYDVKNSFLSKFSKKKFKKEIILYDILYSSFSHVVRVYSIISRLAQQYPQKYTFVFTLPKNVSAGLKLFIEDQSRRIDAEIIIIFLKAEQINLNKSSNLIEALKTTTHVSWINSMRDLYSYLSPKITIMSPALFGNYYYDLQQKEQKILGIIDVYYTPWSLGKIGISPKMTHKNKILQYVMTKIINKKLFNPFFKGIQYQWKQSHINKKFIPKTIEEHFLMYNKLLFPDIPSWEPLINNHDLVRDKYSYIGPLLPQYNKKSFQVDNLLIKKFKEQEKDKKLVTILLGGSFFIEKHKTLINFIELLIKRIQFSRKTRFLIILGQHEYKFNHILTKEPNVMVISHFVPFDIIFKYTDVALATLGQGTVMEAIKQSVHLVGLPINADQYSHGQRLEYFEIGQLVQKYFPWEMSDNTVFYSNITKKNIIEKIAKKILEALECLNNKDNFALLKKEIIELEKKQANNILENIL